MEKGWQFLCRRELVESLVIYLSIKAFHFEAHGQWPLLFILLAEQPMSLPWSYSYFTSSYVADILWV